MHNTDYIERISISSPSLGDSIRSISDQVFQKITDCIDYKGHTTGLLLGNVQSGKTAQLMGVVSKLADEGFSVFLVLTTDNVFLQQQTQDRLQKNLTTFNICGEYDDIQLLNWDGKKPLLLVLKKNTNVLKKWKNLLASSGVLSGRQLVIIDDEADAASLNTLVNKNRVSTINGHLQEIKKLSSCSLYIEVTATPQAIVLQSSISGWKPDFIHYFKPGPTYIGGDLIYSEPRSYTIKITPDNELDDIKAKADIIPVGLRDSLLCFLIVCAHFKSQDKDTCNFLVHPSVKIHDHEIFASVLGETLNSLLDCLRDEALSAELIAIIKNQWLDLQKTQPDIVNFEDCCKIIENILDNINLSIVVMNSKTDISVNYSKGYNIIIGGNSLGRGVTFPALQIVYYCRKSKTPQADTFWQHSRIFGYDRVAGLIRVFLPEALHQLFVNLNDANNILINQIENNNIEGIQLIYPSKINPTRKNVLDKRVLRILVGGVNFFPRNPVEDNCEAMDLMLANYNSSSNSIEISCAYMIDIINLLGNYDASDWDSKKTIACIKSLMTKRPSQKYTLIVRRDRDISKGTGTLLAPNDRLLSDSLSINTVLILYRIVGSTSKGWSGKPFWIPNIKFPNDICFFDTADLD